MDDNDSNVIDEKSEKKLKIKADKLKMFMPPETKKTLIIGGAIFGIVFFILIFIVLITPIYILLFNGNSSSSDSNLAYIKGNSEDNFWWPIGGNEIEKKDGIEYATGTPATVQITSYYNLNRKINGVSSPHPAIDISGTTGDYYIISSMKGTVYYTNDTCSNNGAFNVSGVSSCGGGFGNYIILEHPGSVYTLYAHLYPGSITVSTGDIVNQGQIIGKMGNSGNSTGTHLHFQLEVGGRGQQYAVNPLDYISAENPRPVTISSGTGSAVTSGNQLLAMLHSWEGGEQYTSGEYSIVYDDGYGYLSVGHGIALQYNVDKFKKRGVDVTNMKSGSKIKTSIVEEIEIELVNEKKSSVESLLYNNGITLEEYQIDALVIRMYNVGNVNAFPNNYKKYGNTKALYDNYMRNPVTSNNQYSLGLDRRRQAEWKLFHTGVYTFNS